MNDLRGKVALVTGATNGIGRAAALGLARAGATLVLVGRNAERIEKTVAEIRRASGNDAVEGALADLSLLSEVRRLAMEFQEQHEHLHLLLNNAGAIFSEHALTAEGHERTFALNHLAYFLLTNQLLPQLTRSAPARIINVSSSAHRGAGSFDFDNIDGRKTWGMMGFSAYGLSKLANILFTRELARRLAGTGVTANAVHPGVVNTGFLDGTGWLRPIARVLGPFLRSPEKGAETLLWLALSPELAQASGGYYADRKPSPLSAGAQDEAAARRLWSLSAEICGLEDDQAA